MKVKVYQSYSSISEAIDAKQYSVTFVDIDAQYKKVFEALMSLDKRFGNNYMLSLSENAVHLFFPSNIDSTEQNKKALWKSLYVESIRSKTPSFDWKIRSIMLILFKKLKKSTFDK